MNRFHLIFALIASLAAPASAFTMDWTIPTLPLPGPTETSQSCVSPLDVTTTACSVTE